MSMVIKWSQLCMCKMHKLRSQKGRFGQQDNKEDTTERDFERNNYFSFSVLLLLFSLGGAQRIKARSKERDKERKKKERNKKHKENKETKIEIGRVREV